jgi:hypothetical protein
MPPTVTMWQTDPVQSIALSEDGVVVGREETGNPSQRPDLHLLDGFGEFLLNCAIQDSGVLKGHIER